MNEDKFNSRLAFKIAGGISLAAGILLTITALATNYFTERANAVQAVRYTETLASARAASFSTEITGVVVTARNAALNLATLESVPPGVRRAYGADYLKTMLQNNPRFYGIWTVWEPGTFDGLDAAFEGKPGSTPDGRFGLRWTMDPDKATDSLQNLPQFKESGTDGLVELAIVPTLEAYRPKLLPWLDQAYSEVRSTGQERILEPYTVTVGSVPELMTSFVTPVKNRFGRVLGVVGVDIRLATFVQIFMNERLYESGFVRLLSAQGTVIYAPNRNLAGTRAEELAGSDGDDIVSAMDSMTVLSGAFPAESDSERMAKSFVPVRIGNAPQPWIVATSVPRREMLADSRRQLTMLVAAFVIAAILLSAVVVLQSSFLLAPVKKTALALEEISAGDGDLTRRLPVTSRDEVGKLANDFNGFIAKLQEIVSSVRGSGERLARIGTELSANMEETGAAVFQINSNIDSVKNQVLDQAAGVNETSATVQEITRNIDALSSVIDAQTGSISDSSASVEQMIANIESVTKNLEKINDSFGNLKDLSENGYGRIGDVIGLVKSIETKSASLAEANTIVTSIAARTNLLAMNAAIEAAHAGEAGSGFAVVADEIRKLAENAAAQSKTITRELRDLKGAIDRVVVSSEEAGSAFNGVRESVAGVAEQQRQIHAAMEEQGIGNARVLEALGRMRGESSSVNSQASLIREGSKAILDEMSQLVEITQRIKESMDEMSAGTTEINKALGEVVSLSGDNREGIRAVLSEIGRFKTGD